MSLKTSNKGLQDALTATRKEKRAIEKIAEIRRVALATAGLAPEVTAIEQGQRWKKENKGRQNLSYFTCAVAVLLKSLPQTFDHHTFERTKQLQFREEVAIKQKEVKLEALKLICDTIEVAQKK